MWRHKNDRSTYGLIYNCCHDVTKDAKLEEIAQLYASVSRQHHGILVKIEYESKSLERISHELRQVIIEVFIDELNICSEVRRELLQVIEYLPEILLDKCQQFRELDVADTSDHEVSHSMVLITD